MAGSATDRPFILWRRPFAANIECLFPDSADISETFIYGKAESGFILQPFASESSARPLRIKGLASTISKQEVEMLSVKPSSTNSGISTKREEHISAIATGIDRILVGEMKKVVLARKLVVDGMVNPAAVFQKAEEQYPSAFVYLLHLPEIGAWLGASPEGLLKINDETAQIDSLAGTQLAANGQRSRNWSEKEVEEQAIVTKYIDEQLSDAGISERTWHGPKDHLAGKLLHLQSQVKFNLQWEDERTQSLLERLHPTPAVCGAPRPEALKTIAELEDFDRELYAGYLGPVEQNGRTDLFVNLRCMKINAENVEIFAGGGITAASDPEAEWLETEHKCQTMLDLLR